MVRTETPICDFNQGAIDFNLKGVDGNYYNLNSLKGQNGLLVMFICNHCPYVKSVIHRIIRDTNELKGLGVKFDKQVQRMGNKISDKVLSLLKESEKSSLSTDKITEDLAWKRINS